MNKNPEGESDAATGATIYRYKIETRATWSEVGQHFDLHHEAARKRARDYADKNNLPPPNRARIVGGFDEAPRQNGRELWQRAINIQQRQAESRDYRAQRRVIYDDGPVVLIAMADLHLGGMGVNYLSIDADIRLINELDKAGVNVAVLLVGDMLDGFIIGKLKDLRLHSSPFSLHWTLVWLSCWINLLVNS